MCGTLWTNWMIGLQAHPFAALRHTKDWICFSKSHTDWKNWKDSFSV